MDEVVSEELAAVDAIRAHFGDDAERAAAAVAGRRMNWRRLQWECKLDEVQVAFLGRHVRSVLRDLRLRAVDDMLGFLPPRLERSLGVILRDGVVTTDERAGFLPRVDQDGRLLPEERAQVAILVDKWYIEDHPA